MAVAQDALRAHVRELRVLCSTDPSALGRLCHGLWLLGQQDESLEIYHRLLQDEDLRNESFDADYLAALKATDTCPVPMRRRHRLMELVRLLHETEGIAGAVAECGCFRGMSSYVLCSTMRREDPSFDGAGYHIFDSFQGLSEPTTDDEIPDGWDNAEGLRLMSRAGSFEASLDSVRRNLGEFPQISFHPGWIPASFKHLCERRYRFVHVDVDLYDPTLDAFHYFYPRLAAGGTLVSDDYSWPGARTAIDEFSAETGAVVEISAHHQAVVRKPA